MDSNTDLTKTFSELSQSSGEKSSLDFHIHYYVIAKVYIMDSKTKSKRFVGKVCSGPDNNVDFEIAFLEGLERQKNGFLFPYNEDMASIYRKDI